MILMCPSSSRRMLKDGKKTDGRSAAGRLGACGPRGTPRALGRSPPGTCCLQTRGPGPAHWPAASVRSGLLGSQCSGRQRARYPGKRWGLRFEGLIPRAPQTVSSEQEAERALACGHPGPPSGHVLPQTGPLCPGAAPDPQISTSPKLTLGACDILGFGTKEPLGSAGFAW